MLLRKAKSAHFLVGDEAVSITADEFPETEAERLDTGLLDAFGRPIRKAPSRVPMGFRIR